MLRSIRPGMVFSALSVEWLGRNGFANCDRQTSFGMALVFLVEKLAKLCVAEELWTPACVGD